MIRSKLLKIGNTTRIEYIHRGQSQNTKPASRSTFYTFKDKIDTLVLIITYHISPLGFEELSCSTGQSSSSKADAFTSSMEPEHHEAKFP